jgi:predicted porin
LILSALALACAAGAHAQSSVTLYGIVDTSFQHFRAGGVGTQNAVGSGGLSTSRLGFRGVEDLGGGLRAGFWLESSLNTDVGTGRATNTNNQPSGATLAGGLQFDRNAYVSLAGNWGEVRLGHDFVPTHWNSIYFDPFNANGVARAGNFTFSAVTSGSLPTTITASNSVSYWLPPGLGGFYGEAMYAVGENLSNAPNADDGRLAGARLGWTNKQVDVAAAYTHTHFNPGAAIGNYTHANVGASWNLGFAKLFALYNTVHVDVLGGPVKKRTWEVGAHIPVSPAGRIRLTYARLDDRSAATLLNANGSARAGNDAHLWGVGYVHDLSKRTALYGTYARITNKGQATYTVSGGPAPAAGGASTGLEVGVRHLF